MPKKPQIAHAADVRRTKNGRYQYKSTGRFAPTVNGQPIAEGWRKDKRGRVYNVERKREQARRNFRHDTPGKPPGQKPSLARRHGIALWKGPPPVLYRTTYLNTGEIDRILADPEKAAALSAWCDEHGKPGEDADADNRGQVFGRFFLTVSRHATDWGSGLLGWYPKSKQWRYYASTPIAEHVADAVANADDERDKYPPPDDGGEKATDRLAIYFPIKAIPQQKRDELWRKIQRDKTKKRKK